MGTPTSTLDRMIVAIVNFTFPQPMSLEAAATAFESSAPSYQHVAGLRRKHYLLATDGLSGGGVYLWDSQAEAEALYDQAWSERIEARYGAAPTVTYFHSPVTVDPISITVD